MKILAIETSTDACSVALDVDGSCIERFATAPRQHAELVLAQIEALLAQAGWVLGAIDCLAFGRGPGSFTGLRIASGVIQGLAAGADLPVVPVSSLQALAQGGARDGVERAFAAFDARMGEVYAGAYARPAGPEARNSDLQNSGPQNSGAADLDALMVEVVPDAVCAPAALPRPPGAGWVGLGAGWAAHAGALADVMGDALERVEPERLPRARDVATLAAASARAGHVVTAREALPVYLRDRVAHQRAAPSQARA